jgi:hypothetical protein
MVRKLPSSQWNYINRAVEHFLTTIKFNILRNNGRYNITGVAKNLITDVPTTFTLTTLITSSPCSPPKVYLNLRKLSLYRENV